VVLYISPMGLYYGKKEKIKERKDGNVGFHEMKRGG
jgi:hypothetical protein